MDDNFFQESTKAYIVAYNTAMELMKNPNAAAQVAMSVTMTYMSILRSEMKQKQEQLDIGRNVVNMLTSIVKRQDGQEGEEDSEKK